MPEQTDMSEQNERDAAREALTEELRLRVAFAENKGDVSEAAFYRRRLFLEPDGYKLDRDSFEDGWTAAEAFHDAGYADARAASEPWVRIEGKVENLPIREKVYWVTERDGRVEKWRYYQSENDMWLENAIAWMPDEPPAPYKEKSDGGE